MRYHLYARRRPEDDWRIWSSTEKFKVTLKGIDTIENYGYEWKCDELMGVVDFKLECYRRGIRPSYINEYIKDRKYFGEHDIKRLEKKK